MRDPAKGLLHGQCYRGACSNNNATWYSSVEQQHYCQSCAMKINAHLPQGVAKIIDLAKLHSTFTDINRKCMDTGESVVALSDAEYYSAQIEYLELAPNSYHAVLIAQALSRYDAVAR